MNRPTLPLPFSLNCVIRLASPNPVRQDSTHDSSVCSGTCDCRNRVLRSGSTPIASSSATVCRVLAVCADRSGVVVSACRSATK